MSANFSTVPEPRWNRGSGMSDMEVVLWLIAALLMFGMVVSRCAG